MASPPEPPSMDRLDQARMLPGRESVPTGTPRKSPPITLIGPRPATWLLFPAGITALLVVGYILMRLYEKIAAPLPSDIRGMFHIGTEHGVVAWWNSTLLLAIAALALLLAALSGPGRPAPGRIGRASWLLVAATIGLLGLDESIELHERLGAPADHVLGGDAVTLFTFAWVFPGAIVAFVGCLLTVRWARRLPFDLRIGLFAALATYVTGALGIEALNGWLKRQHADLAVQLGTLVEETMEMGGCLVALATFAAALVLARDSSGKLTLALRSDLDPRTRGRSRTGTVAGTTNAANPPGDPSASNVLTRSADPEEVRLLPDPHDEMR